MPKIELTYGEYFNEMKRKMDIIQNAERRRKMQPVLRVCGLCEWIFRSKVEDGITYLECPKCGFGSFSARYVYGTKCYGYEKNQAPWLTKKILDYEAELKKIIDANKREMKKEEKAVILKLVKTKG